jgi:Holliday junction resolvase-like predicted endonuclease
MISPAQRRASLKAASLYLEMRGHELIEQQWSSSKFKIDLIAMEGVAVEFIKLNYTPEGEVSDVADSAAALKSLEIAAGVWIDQTKYIGPRKLMVIDVYGNNYDILGFNEVFDSRN